MPHIFDMIVIGGGPAGYTAALYAARAGLEVLVLEQMSAGGQMAQTGDIENYPGFDEGINGFELGLKMQRCAENFGAKTEYARVISVDFNERIKIVNSANTAYRSKTVVIAAGANPRRLGVPSEQRFAGRGIHYCAHCDGRFYKGKTVAVVGGGNSAAADALYLSRIAKKVLVVHRRDALRAEKVLRVPLLKAENVEFLWNSTVSELIAEDRLSGVKTVDVNTKKVTNIHCDGVFVCIGRKPATEFLKDSVSLDKYGYIIADESTVTSVRGVFAAGDVRTKAMRQIITAASDGAVAAHFAEEYISETER